MKKIWVFILLILFSCQPDELMIVEPYPQYEMVFEVSESTITDGQEISFEILVEEKYWLIISDEETNSVVSKESFLPLAGLNTRRIYTNSLPKKRLKLTLENEVDILKSTFVIVN